MIEDWKLDILKSALRGSCSEKPRPVKKSLRARPEADRFWEKVNKTTTCWLWTAAQNNGYGVFHFGGKHSYAHIFSMGQKEQLIKGLVIDHLCRNKLCVNPEHLEQVTFRENVVRAVPYRKKRSVSLVS